MPRILNFGSINYDHIYCVEDFVKPEETIASTKYTIIHGGKGLNQSIALSRAGAQVYHAGAVGKQDGDSILKTLSSNGVNTDFVARKDCNTGHAIIQVNSRGQNCILIWGGANVEITEDQIADTFAHFSEGDFLLLQNETNLLKKMISLAKERKIKIVLNPSPMNKTIRSLPLELVDYLILNEVEAKAICGVDESHTHILDRITKMLPNAHIVMTVGAQGVYHKRENAEAVFHPAYRVEAVDTTAAGDTFTGYFIASVALGGSIQTAMQLASKAAAIAVTRFGAEPSIPYKDEVEQKKLAPQT